MNSIIVFLSHNWVPPLISLTSLVIGFVALTLSFYANSRVWKRWWKEDNRKDPDCAFLTGSEPFNAEWRQGVIDIQFFADQDWMLMEISAYKPQKTILALGFDGDTNKGPNENNSASKQKFKPSLSGKGYISGKKSNII